MQLRGVRLSSLVAYAFALAAMAAATVFFGFAGFLLGVAVLLLVAIGIWAAPLIKLSYAEERERPSSP
jgi:fatty acid desaturase